MDSWSSKAEDIVDAHVHMRNTATKEPLLSICKATGIGRMALVSIQNPEAGTGLPQSLYMKSRHPACFYVFAGLNHAEWLSGGKVAAPGLPEQVDAIIRMGCDGIKMIEGKPSSRQRMNVPVTDPYFSEYWGRVEELGLPIVWHVNDPEEFWDEQKIPDWARQRNWGYGPTDVQKEELYAEVDEVLAKHFKLKVIFGHFYFLSADLRRAARFLDEHPTVHFDLAPGIELLHNISKDPEAGREFFLKYADRIVFGTDISSDMSMEQGLIRAGIVFRWLESDDTFGVPTEADSLLGPGEDGIIRGMCLPSDALAKIYRENFVRLAGGEPRRLDLEACVQECERLAAIAEAMSGRPAAETEAAMVAKQLFE